MPYRVAVAGVAMLVLFSVARVRFCDDVDVPPMPARPAPTKRTAIEVNRTMERSPALYAEFLRKDARAYRIEPPPGPGDMGHGFVHRIEDSLLMLDPGDKKKNQGEALGLVLVASVEAIEGTSNRQMVLSIENTTDQNLAYRVVSRPSRGTKTCHQKRDLAHNAVALSPGAIERRSECLWNKGWSLAIDRVEVIELPPLSFHYVSLLPPSQVGIEPRTGRGHRSPSNEPLCRLFHSAEIENRLQGGAEIWRNMIDFYARHRCKTYTFSIDYKAPDAGAAVALPAVPEGG